jgi:hypothetical protein
MRKRLSKKKLEAEPTPEPAAEQTAAEPAPEPALDGKNPAAVALGRLGGKKGGPARAAKLTEGQRQEIARRAAQARWKKSEGGESAVSD